MGMQILIDAIERAGTLDTDKVKKALGETDVMVFPFERREGSNAVFSKWVENY